MQRAIFVSIFLLTVGNLAHCQEWENLLFIKMEVLLEKQEAALSQLKGMQEKQEQVEGKLQEIQEKQEHVEGKLQEMQEKLQHVEINLQEFHHELEHMKGAVNSNQDSLENISTKLETLEEIHQETKGCLGREDLEHFKNISSAGQEELESLLRQEISGVISLLETGGIDECSEGSHNCTDYEACADKLFQYQCSCLPGFARDDSLCEDVDECAQGKDECSPLATCRNSVGSYSCSCNPPFEGDGESCFCPTGFAQKGLNCEESPCESEAKYFEGLGCVKFVWEFKTFEGMKATCHRAGGRLLQDFTYERLQEVGRAFDLGWLGVREGKWLESGLPLQEELWHKGSRGSDPSGRRGLCGVIALNLSSSLYKVGQLDCSEKRFGYCQILIPQK